MFHYCDLLGISVFVCPKGDLKMKRLSYQAFEMKCLKRMFFSISYQGELTVTQYLLTKFLLRRFEKT